MSVTAATESSWLDVQGGVVLPRNAQWGFSPVGWERVSYEDFVSWGRVNKKQIRTGPAWKRTSWNWPTCRDRRLHSRGVRRRKERRRSGSWMRKTLRSSAGWRWDAPASEAAGSGLYVFMLCHPSLFILPELPIYLVLPPALFQAHDLSLLLLLLCVSKCINTTCSVFIVVFCIFSGLFF